MAANRGFPQGAAATAARDAAFSSGKAALPSAPLSQGTGASRYHYRITVDMLEHPAGEEGLQSLSFFASTPHDILAAARTLRARLGCSASQSAKLAVALSLVGEVMHTRREPGLFSEPMRDLLASLDAAPAKTDA